MVNCHNCHANGPAYYHGVQGISATPALAADKWNRRDTVEVLRLTARIAALEAVAKAGDGLAEAVNDVVNDRHLTDAEFDEFMADTAAKLTAYRAAKEAANG
jgi:hypothetical protein